MNWQISRIEVSSFKAFKHILLDFENSSLLTLDGPNGFGKTSIFDAIELLLTGQIKRIENLFSKVMIGTKQNYDDNLFWNIRSGEKNLVIKIEFFKENSKLTLARYASAEALKQKSLNRADSFSQFNLYELPDFSSNDFSADNLRNNDYIEEIFGENFRENFCYLNYLEQGQNQLLLTKVDKRKQALGNLFNITDIAAEIDNCKSVERKINSYINDTARKSQEMALLSDIESLRVLVQADLGAVEYKKLSTSDLQPGWDYENLFPTYSLEVFKEYQDVILKLQELLPLKSAIKIRAQNEQIESYIHNNMALLQSLVQFGIDTDKLSALDSTKNELNQLIKAKAIIQRGAAVITLPETRSLPYWEAERLNRFEDQITVRKDLQLKNQSNSGIAAELTRLKDKLLKEHGKLSLNDPTCPLCGADWIQHQIMLDAVDARSQQITNSLSADGKALVELLTLMNSELALIATQIQSREAAIQSEYNESLHNALESERVRLESITKLAKRLEATGTTIDYRYSDKNEVVEERLRNLIFLIRSRKTEETDELPDDWKQVISVAFKSIEDFYIVEQKDLTDKISYITSKANEARNIKLKNSLESLQTIQCENEAAKISKDKVKKLRETLENVERSYTDQTISEIELIFHIYSGRLIQNYQRGLGLFIESRDGKQLRFLTAEKSEHDAILSMSSGQVSALSMAFFLSLNKVYARVPIILIDDPSQSLDEVNVASLTDLLRCELKQRQLILSSHEEDISSYMRYRFAKAGRSTRSLNMQRLAKEAS
ncbi:recombinase RecF [Vibrio tarriae]|uniref:Recombinase RecF n=1 Tax=Vibrio tarriae TaxID=2014742 RepID=A0AAU8WWN0_9VIBR|nr:AAA family ATPase [Vibrio tarriae]ASK56260.1 recombinase RecF [Vibrio tarriae]